MRRHTIALLAVVLVAGLSGSSVQAQHRLWISPDTPTDLDLAPTYLPWQVIEHRHLDPAPYALEFVVPGDPAIDALERMDAPGSWLFSIEAPNDLAGLIPVTAEPRDVLRMDGAAVFSFFFDGSCVGGVVPITSSIDALYLQGGDAGALIVSFDVPTTIGAATFQPSELVRYQRTGPSDCDWLLVGSEIDFAAALGTYFPSSGNVTAADRNGDEWIVAWDIPEDLGPPGVTTFTPGEIVETTGLGAAVSPVPFDDLQVEGAPSWPISSVIDALACQANPGSIFDPTTLPVGLTMGKAVAPAGDVVLFWGGGSCSSGAEDYGVYEGTLAAVSGGAYDHVRKTCSDTAPFLEEQVTPLVVDTYYLVVPHNNKVEGSYCTASDGTSRPQPVALADRCIATRVLTDCP